jgi:PhnB protein
MMRQSEMPNPPAGAGNAIVHAQMEIGETKLIANDVPPDVFKRIRSAYLYLSVDSTEEAERVHKLLAEGGEIYMPMEETFYATRFSMLRDRFGVSWTVIHERPAS